MTLETPKHFETFSGDTEFIGRCSCANINLVHVEFHPRDEDIGQEESELCISIAGGTGFDSWTDRFRLAWRVLTGKVWDKNWVHLKHGSMLAFKRWLDKAISSQEVKS